MKFYKIKVELFEFRFRPLYDFKSFSSFFFKKSIFSLFRSLYFTGEKSKVRKKTTFLCSFIEQNPFEIILRFQNFSKFFFRKINFLLFRPLCCKGEKREVREKSFSMLFYSAKFNWDHFTISNFSSFFQKVNFLTVSTLYCTGEKNHFLVLFQSAKSVSDHFTISKLFQVFFSKN